MRLKKFIFERKFLLLNIILSIYVATNLIGGERGLIAYFNKKNIEDLKVMQKRELIKNLNDIEKKNVLISNLKMQIIFLIIIFVLQIIQK